MVKCPDCGKEHRMVQIHSGRFHCDCGCDFHFKDGRIVKEW